MSAIAGIFRLNGQPVESADVERMNASLAHRGNRHGVWTDGTAGLAARLRGLTAESQIEPVPLIDRDGPFVLVSDARIDNREALCRQFDLAATPEATDGALILAAYRKWGESCPEHLLGDFAFAVWDGRKRRLFCARDHFGARPFYYFHRPGKLFCFGSEQKALFQLRDVPRHLNETRVADYFVPIQEDTESTFFSDVLRLPAAHTLIVGTEGFEKRRYWALDPERTTSLGSDGEYAEAFRELFCEAVRCRIRGTAPIGSMLSGGLDSGSIAAVARNQLRQAGRPPLHTVSAIFDEVRQCDEREYMQPIIDQGHIEPHFIHADQISPLVDIDVLHWHQDEPFYAPNMFMHWALYREAATHGVGILLDGLDGDTTVSHGVPYLHELFRRGRWLRMAREIRGVCRVSNGSPVRIFWKRAVKPAIPDWLRQVKRVASGRRGELAIPVPTLRRDFIERVGLVERERLFLGHRSRPPRSAREDHYNRLRSGMIPFVLEISNKAAAAFSIEPRYPFFDVRLAEFCLAAPSSQKLNNGWTRYIMRNAMEGILPPSVQWRPTKSNLSGNIERGLLLHEKERLDEIILGQNSELEPFMDKNKLKKAYEDYKHQSTSQNVMEIWKPVSLALWLRSVNF